MPLCQYAKKQTSDAREVAWCSISPERSVPQLGRRVRTPHSILTVSLALSLQVFVSVSLSCVRVCARVYVCVCLSPQDTFALCTEEPITLVVWCSIPRAGAGAVPLPLPAFAHGRSTVLHQRKQRVAVNTSRCLHAPFGVGPATGSCAPSCVCPTGQSTISTAVNKEYTGSTQK